MKFVSTLKLPDYVSLLNGLSGLFSIIFLFQGNLTFSLLMIFVAIFFDFMDGKVARKFGNGSEFGKDIDSLCDVISFGFAPAFQVAAVFGFNIFGLLLASLWLLAGIIRLARFNVLNIKSHYLGTPITLSAGIVALVNLLTPNIYILGFFYFVFSLLMVSDLKIKKI